MTKTERFNAMYSDDMQEAYKKWADEQEYCPRCDGSGWIPTSPLDGMEHYEFGSNGTKTCPLCAGTGK